jgi:hypothetical protein
MHMTVSDAQLSRLLDQALEHFEAPAGCAIVLEGSLAEGFGNETSDVDFLVLDETPRDFNVLPTLLFLDGRRVEMRIRSVEKMRGYLRVVRDVAAGDRVATGHLDEEDLDRCQRFLKAKVLRNPELVDLVRSELGEDEFAETVSMWFGSHARTSARCAYLLLLLEDQQAAAAWARSALTQAAKSLLARHGETYLAKKWLSTQLERAAAQIDLYSVIMRLESPRRARSDPRKYVREVLEILPNLGVNSDKFDANYLHLQKVAGVTTWQIGSRLHVVSADHGIFVLGRKATKVWRCLTFGRPLPEILEHVSRDGSESVKLIADFHALGLVDVVWKEVGRIAMERVSGGPPTAVRPLVTLEGGLADDTDDDAVTLLSGDPQKFVAAGGMLAYSCMVVDNSREDAIGALQAEQWRVFERAIRRLVRYCSMMVLSAWEAYPPPPLEEAPLHLSRIRTGIAKWVVSEIIELDDVVVDDSRTAHTVLQRANRVYAEVRRLADSDTFPDAFASASDWDRALRIGNDWARLGAYLDAPFPLEQARELIASGGHQSHLKASPPEQRSDIAAQARAQGLAS